MDEAEFPDCPSVRRCNGALTDGDFSGRTGCTGFRCIFLDLIAASRAGGGAIPE